MMTVLLVCAIAALNGCLSGSEKTVPIAAEKDVVKPRPVANKDSVGGCYQMVIDKDTAWLQVTHRDSTLTGSLVYKRFKRDSNNGNVFLTMAGDKFAGLYHFETAGKKAVRQIVFKPDSDNLLEGYGDLDMKNDSAYFKYPGTLQFENKHPFIRTRCE